MYSENLYPHIRAAVYGSPWAILPEKLDEIVGFLNLKASGGVVSAEVVAALDAAAKRSTPAVSGSVAVVPVYGTIAQRMDLMHAFSGGTSTERIGAMLDKALADDTVGAVVLDVDSPGGSVYGVAELAEKIFNSREARSGKPIIAIANSLMASAAFWLGTSADQVVITPGGEMGSVGVVAMHGDYSKAEEKAGRKTSYVYAGRYKVEGNPYEPLNDEARAAIQSRVDEYYTMFVDDLARNRGVSTKTVRERFGQGRVVGAAAAVDAKMADRVASFEQLVSDLRGRGKTRSASRAASRTRDMELAKIRRPTMR